MLAEQLSKYDLILGSKSPRRKELLAGLDIPFEQRSKETDESFPSDLPVNAVAEFLAQKKAAAFESDLRDTDLLICSDTTVVVEGEILNKASDEAEAALMINRLSGKKHQVITGVCIKTKTKERCFTSSTQVQFKSLSQDEIAYYIKKYQPFDKAGAYGIQEWIGFIGIEKIEGDYYTVMGLPLSRLYEALQEF